MNGIRISDGISRANALSQLTRQEMATHALAGTFKDIKFSSLRIVNIADQKSRHDGFSVTDAFTDLKEQVRLHEKDFDAIIVWFTDSIRIGSKREHVTSLKTELSKISKKVSVICLKDAGKDPELVAKSVEEYLEVRAAIGKGASHVNAGKNLPRSTASQQLAEQIQAERVVIHTEVALLGKLDDKSLAAVERGKALAKTNPDLERLYGHCVASIEKDLSSDNVERMGRVWINEVGMYQFDVQIYEGGGGDGEEDESWLYLRTTPTEDELEEVDEEGTVSGRKYYDDVPVEQWSGCTSAKKCVGDNREVDFSVTTILSDKRKSRTIVKRPAFTKLMTNLGMGRIKYLFMDSMNRASGRLAQNLLLIKVCQLVNAEIILAKNVGQAKEVPADGEPTWDVTATDVAKMDDARMKDLESAKKICKEEIEELSVTFSDCEFLFKDMSDKDKVKLSKELTEIGAKLVNRKKYKEMAAEISQWFNNKDEDDIFDESSEDDIFDESSEEDIFDESSEEDDDDYMEDESSGEEDENEDEV
eukprot:CAMPEP_0113379704 /NCGR_PEP_ID=MMETSP0013_2-20120614/4365_1 /TAXON_ID=2843 ORGANISM="Skeletonema costatum, Strain 1716" /NCGR_SAMPLE_ID=MMETSP0013_2 /ASSEMBLY_ACC=CAM_ASM_000158 /LENGTH=531 /DNA_ID=CAMNT_0000261991 /DNA_START=137 /DNA_END=1732 /DNA_ORIENTATION=- /assembly_acc=CAM_ASM_000158